MITIIITITRIITIYGDFNNNNNFKLIVDKSIHVILNIYITATIVEIVMVT